MDLVAAVPARQRLAGTLASSATGGGRPRAARGGLESVGRARTLRRGGWSEQVGRARTLRQGYALRLTRPARYAPAADNGRVRTLRVSGWSELLRVPLVRL